jgi:hypothetical protein
MQSFGQQNPVKTGWYFLSEKPADGILVPGVDPKNIFALEPVQLLSVDDFKAFRIVQRDFKPEPFKAIEMQMNKSGKTKWNAAKKRISKTREAIVFVFNGTVYCEKYIYADNKTLTTYIDLVLADTQLNEVFAGLEAGL